MQTTLSISDKIKNYSVNLGFDVCGFCRAENIDTKSQASLSTWLNAGYHADMDYLSRNTDKRNNPALLVEKAKTIICVALNYYPDKKQDTSVPQFAYYAYGLDYHDVLKIKLNKLLDYIKELIPGASGRVFTDTAPIMERYWAVKAGLGFIGKNTLLIIPGKGSFFFLGEIILDTELRYDTPIKNISCGNCSKCIEACPTKAIEANYILNSNKCISYQTIENKKEIEKNIIPLLSNRIYGCDICQSVCPWNKFAKPNTTNELTPNDEFLSLTAQTLETMTVEDYNRIFKKSAVKRAKYAGLKRNLEALRKSNQI